MFRIGQKVVCVDDSSLSSHPNFAPWDGLISTGTVYVVRWVDRHMWADGTVGCGVKLCGIVRRYGDGDTPYSASRFRAVVEKKTDISMFEEILKRETVDDRAPAQVR